MAKSVNVLGVKIDSLNHSDLIMRLEELCKKRGKSQIVTINPEFIITAQTHHDFMKVLNTSSLRLADGSGLLVAAKFNSLKLTRRWGLRTMQAIYQLKLCILASVFHPKYLLTELRARLAGADIVNDLIDLSLQHNYRIFLLGAAPGVAEKASLKLQTDNYGLRVAGTFGGSPSIDEEEKIISIINKHKTDILLVAYGAPKQDLWIARNLKKTSAKIAIGVGGTFDFVAGRVPRAPLWMQYHGLEWFYRLILSPKKRFVRQLSLIKFLLLLIQCRLESKKDLT